MNPSSNASGAHGRGGWPVYERAEACVGGGGCRDLSVSRLSVSVRLGDRAAGRRIAYLLAMRGAIHNEAGSALLLVDDLEIEEPRSGEVLVRVAHCGICHSDQTIRELLGGPIVLGHEAAGVVEAVGSGVGHLAVGDHVMLSPVAPCGCCPACARNAATECSEALGFMTARRPDGSTPLSRAGAEVGRGLGVGGFAERTVVSASGAVRIDPDIPLDVVCVIGCAVQTGVGAVLNTAGVEPGSSVLVMGLGAIGQAVVQGARIAGATVIVASDPLEGRREAATGFGATHAIDPGADDLQAAVADITGGAGVDYAFEAAGVAALVSEGLAATRIGGTTVLVGVPGAEQTAQIGSVAMFVTLQKRLVGSLIGGCRPDRDIPLLIDLWRSGRLDLESMTSHRVGLDDIEKGFENLAAADGIRTVVTLAP